ncbi:conserved membrane hypothetical protein [Tenacibaculum sp. 190524A02b]|uniref:EamA domain-containing protein n=1 Tax=Tenacibaculum vairaonense TaxID=3137860 RepID=A0ABM9PRN8_9FLAO
MDNIKKSFQFLIVGAILIAFTPVLIKAADAPGTTAVFYRFFFGSITLIIPFVFTRIKSKETLNKKGVCITIVAGLCIAIYMHFWATGIMISNAAIPTLLLNLAPVWVGIGAFLLFKERQKLIFWIGLIIAFLGVSLLITQNLMLESGMVKGLVLGFLSGVFYALFMLIAQSGRKLLDTLSFLFISSLITTIFLGVFMCIQGFQFTNFSTQTWIYFIIMGVLQAGAWYLINYAQGYLSASIVSPTLLAQPVLAAVFAFLLLGEELTVWQITSGIIVVIGIYTVHFSKHNKR